MARDALLRLGAGSDSWAFVGGAMRFLDQNTDDAEIRAVLSARLTTLGLTTLAREQFERLPDEWRTHADMAPLRAAVDAPARDAISSETLRAVCSANVEALRARGVDLTREFEAWSTRLNERACFRARDGNVVRRLAVRDGAGMYEHLRDLRSEAAKAKIDLPSPEDAAANAAPIVLEGVDPPWMLQRLVEATPTLRNGQRTRIDVVQANAQEFLDGLALADLRATIGDDRTHWWVGQGAAERLGESLDARMGTILRGPALRLPSVRTVADPPIERVLEAAAERQSREHERLSARINAFYGSRGVAYWRERFDEALGGSGKPLRVLLPTCRYSTFVRHSAEDMAEALRGAGHETLVLIEPDDRSRFATVSYLRAFDDFQPDLVILINYARANLGAAMAPGVPFVCWIQDAMPHLFDDALRGPTDFVVGHFDPKAAAGGDAGRFLALSPPVNPRKFFAAPATSEQKKRFECEVAYVGHQSEPPDEMHRRMVDASRANAVSVRILEALYPRVLSGAAGAMERSLHAVVTASVREVIRDETGHDPDDRAVTLVLHQYALPLADRAFRHEALGWTAEIARRRGWRFKLFGNGWDRHPTLGEFAAPAVSHGEDLRACYHVAAAHLHVSVRNMVHQRPVECAMSGGLPLVRMTMDEFQRTRVWSMAKVVREASPDFCLYSERREMWRTWNHWRLIELDFLRQRLGLRRFGCGWVDDWMRPRIEAGDTPRDDQMAHWLYGGLGEATFSHRNDLEERLTLAVERPKWREAMSRLIAERCAATHSTDAAMARTLRLVHAGLTGGPSKCS